MIRDLTTANVQLRRQLEEHGAGAVIRWLWEAGERRVTVTQLHEWASGATRPRERYRKAIERATQGEIPADTWPKERRERRPAPVESTPVPVRRHADPAELPLFQRRIA